MADNLTLQLKQELARRGKVVTDAQIESFLKTKNSLSQVQQQPQQIGQQQTLWSELGGVPDWYEEDSKSMSDNTLSNALGAGLWSFADTALFGVPGAITDEEDFIDFDDPVAKWLSAGGSFLGFVAGAPLKAGVKLGQAVTTKIAPKFGKQGVATVIKGMREAGKVGGVSNKAIKETTQSYRKLVEKAQIDKTLQGEKFGEAVLKYRDEYIELGTRTGIIKTADEAAAIRNMFQLEDVAGGVNVLKRPVQDFIGLAQAQYGNTRFGRFVGHAANDVMIFSMIDAVFEGVTSTGEGRDYDWTAPLWGAANGLAFSSLGLLNPKGKSSSWYKDFKIGIRASFSKKNPYSKMNEEQLAAMSRYMGESLKRSGSVTGSTVKIPYKGKLVDVNVAPIGDKIGFELGSKQTLAEFKRVFGEDANVAMKSFLESERKRFGKEIMKWSTKQEASNLFEVWPRMVLGGLLFNSHSFYHMYANDQDLDFRDDILPNFLIGAYIQRRTNPAHFDLQAPTMNRIRENLAILGFKPDQLTEIPSLAQGESPFRNPLNRKKYEKVLELAESEGIISDNYEQVDTPLSTDQPSIGLPENKNVSFEQIYGWLRGMRAYQTPLDNISSSSAKKIVDEWNKVDPDTNLESITSVEKMLDTESLKMTEEFENNFSGIIGSLKHIDELNIISDLDSKTNTEVLKVPEHIGISNEIIRLAREGKIDWLESDGQQAVEKLEKAFDSLNSIVYMSNELSQITLNKAISTKTITDVENVRAVYDRIIAEENRIDKTFIDKSSMSAKFRFSDNLNDYRFVLLRNHAIRTAQGVTDIFKPENKDTSDELIRYYNDSGLIAYETGRATPLLINSVDQINFKDNADPEKNAERKRFLGRILSLQSIVGKYDRTDMNVNIDASKVDVLRSKLSEFGYNESKMPMWLHKHIVDFAVREKIENTRLTLGDVDAVMALSGYGMGRAGVDVTGKTTSGFLVKLLEVQPIDGNPISERQVVEFNNKIRDIVDRSDGLITLDSDKVLTTNPDLIQLALDSVKPDGGVPFGSNEGFYTSAKSTLSELLNLVSTSDVPGSDKFRDTLGKFLEDNGPEGESRALTWLNQVGIVALKKGETKFDINLEKFNDLVAQQITKKINQYGVSPEYVERYYETLDKNSRDRQFLDSGEGDYVKNITLQEFFTRYRIDGKQETPANEQESVINNLVFENWQAWDDQYFQNRRSRLEVLDRIFERLYVKNRSKTDYVKFTDLTIDEQNKMKPNMIPDFVALVGSRVNQKQIPKIEYKNGKLSLSKEHKQTTRQDKFFEELGIEYNIIDPFVTTYMFSEDGRRVERKRVNIFGDSTNLSEKNLKIINGLREQFNIEMGISREIDGKPIVGENNEVGMLPMRLAPNINPLAIKNSDLTKIRKKFDEFAEIYLSEESPLNEQVKNQIEEIQKSIQVAEDNGRLASGDDYVAALRRLYFKDMLTGNDAIGGDLLFVDFLNKKVDIDKLMGRTKLYDTKKFVTYDQDFIIDVADSYQYIGDRETYKTLMKRVSKNSFGIAVWDDGTSDVREETRKYIENSNLDYVLENAIGDAHKDVSGFDSISYVRKEVLQYLHAMQGHDPNSFNPIKPVISSGGANSPLLMGKTLFIYSKDLDGFFNKQQNKDVDILLSKSGAKSLNAVQEIGADNKPFGKDKSLISNVTWDGLNDYKIKDEKNQIRRVSLSSVGVKPEKDVVNTTGKKSHADMNYARNDESARYFNEEINTPLTQSIRNAQEQIKNPISARRYILDSFGDDSLVSMVDGTESLKHLNGMQFFAGLTRDANPMSFSESIVKNKLYGAFIDPLINNKRSVTNQHDIQNSENYGGQASLVQIPVGYSNMDSRLRPTLVKEDGTYVSRGEVFLPNNVSEMKIAALIDKGYELRLVNDNDVYELTSRMKELGEEKTFQDLLDIDVSLRDLHEFVKTVGIEKGTPNLQIGIIARRNPRTRPNDLSLMGLKGFLEKEYGNSMMLNSFDVANIFEGDYDADKADFFFAERKNMFDHIQRTSAYWVQGVDPTKFMEKSNFSFQLNSTLENEAIEQMSANLDLYKSSIGLVQKVPRMLNYLGNLGSDVATKSVEGKQVAVDIGMIGEENSKVLFEGKDFKIVMDYNNTDFYQRSALETQYIIDGKGNLNQEISNDIYSWRNRFLFPTRKESKSPRQLKEEMDSQQRIGFQNEISRSGHSNKQRVRIFKRLDRQTDGTFSETQDMSNLDKTIVKEFLSEYGKFLSVTGNTAYEKSGEQRRVSYEDIMAASDRFFNFNSKLRESLYYRLRNRNVSLARDKQNKLINKQKFKDTEEFKELFGVQNKAFTDQDGKPIEGKFYQVSTNEKMFDNTVKNNSQEFSEGRRGSPIERTLHKLWDANIFEETRIETLTGQAKEYMNRWYDEFVFDETKGKEEIETSSKILKDNVLKTLTSVNQKINFIKSLNKKIMQIKYNKFQKYDIKMASIEKLNILKEEVQKEVKDFLGNKYFKTKSSKDLEKIEFVDVNTSNMKKGTVYYATIEQIKKFMPLINGDDNFGLNSDAIDKLKDIKQYRRMFYGNQDNLKETLKYGGRSMLSVEQQRFLENFPDMNTYYDIESQLLLQGVNKHGLKFLWAFMQPSVNKYKIGVFEGNPIAVPFEAKEGYDPSSRYRRGLNFLTTVAMERKIGGVDVDPEIAGVSRRALSYVQMVEAQFERFFNKRFDAQKLVSENIGEAFEYGDKQQLKLVYDSIKLPNFHKDFEKRFGDFGTIQWTKTGDRIKNGFGLFNDHLFNFYRELMQAAGKEAEFDTYLKEMHTFQDLMMSNNVINPLQYIHARNGMDADIKNIAQKSLQTALTGKVGSPEISKNLMSNPIYALMGGNSFWKGLTLERQAKFTKEGLKNMAGLSKTIENVKLKSPINETSEERFRKLKDDLIQSGQC